jgi:alpha-beta hydrolase superfamily lysophospholipase
MLYFHRNRAAKGHPVVAAFLSIVIGALVAGGALASRRLDASSGLERIMPFALGVFGALLAVGMIVLRAARGGFEAPVERGRRRKLRLVLAAVIVAIALALSFARQARSQQPARPAAPAMVRGAFVFLAGADTIGIERYARTAGSFSGEITIRGQPRIAWEVPVHADTAAGPLSLTVFAANAAPDAAPSQRVTVTTRGDSIVISALLPNGSTRAQSFKSVAGALPMVNQSAAMFSLVWARARAGGALASVPVFLTAGGQTLDVSFSRVSADSLRMMIGPQESWVATDAGGDLLRVHVPAQRLQMIRVDRDVASRIAIGRPDYSAPADAPYTATDVEIPMPGGHVLAATLTMPKNATGRVPVVVTVTGSGPQDRDEYISLVPGYRLFRQVADTLGRRGIAVLRYDERGAGMSTGNYGASTTRDFADDTKAVLAWLRARPDIDPARTAVVGHSEGGMIGPMVAAEDPRLAALVVMAGPSESLAKIIAFQIRYGIDQDTSIAAAAKDSAYGATKAMFDSTTARAPWFAWGMPYDPLPTARKVRQPVLILQGATDRQVTAEQAEALANAMRAGGNRDVTVKVLPDLNHLFLRDPDGTPARYATLTNPRVDPEALGLLADWLATKLKVAGAR